MTVQFYEVGAADPTDTAQHYRTDASDPPREYAEGRACLTRQTGFTVTPGVDNVPEHNLYIAIHDSSPGPTPIEYYRLDRIDTAWVPGATPADSRVQETNVWVRGTVDDAYDLKLRELENKRNEVFYSACNLSSAGNQALVTASLNREVFASIQGGYFVDRNGDRTDDILSVAAANPTDYVAFAAALQVVAPGTTGVRSRWPSNQKASVLIRNKTSRTERLIQVDDIGEWGAVFKDLGLFDLDTQAAAFACETDIDAAYAPNGKTEDERFDAIVAIDVDTYAWPDYWPDDPTIGTQGRRRIF